MDIYIYVIAVVSAVSMVNLRVLLPKGQRFLSVPNSQRSAVMNVIGSSLLVSFALLMGMIFTGMGLQRAAEFPKGAIATASK